MFSVVVALIDNIWGGKVSFAVSWALARPACIMQIRLHLIARCGICKGKFMISRLVFESSNLESESPVSGSSPSHVGRVPSHVGRVPSHVGRVPSHVGRVPSHVGRVPSHVGRVPSHVGRVPSHVGRVRVMNMSRFDTMLGILPSSLSHNHWVWVIVHGDSSPSQCHQKSELSRTQVGVRVTSNTSLMIGHKVIVIRQSLFN